MICWPLLLLGVSHAFTPASVAMTASRRRPTTMLMMSARPGDAVFAVDKRPVILFDGICNLCNGGVNFVLDFDRSAKGDFRFAGLQSECGRELLQRSGRRPDDISSIVLVYEDRSYVRSEAVLRIGRGLRLPLLSDLTRPAMFVPAPIRDGVYNVVAKNRYNLFGKAQSCRLSDDRFEERFVGDVASSSRG